jgi:hypothetical protein
MKQQEAAANQICSLKRFGHRHHLFNSPQNQAIPRAPKSMPVTPQTLLDDSSRSAFRKGTVFCPGTSSPEEPTFGFAFILATACVCTHIPEAWPHDTANPHP